MIRGFDGLARLGGGHRAPSCAASRSRAYAPSARSPPARGPEVELAWPGRRCRRAVDRSRARQPVRAVALGVGRQQDEPVGREQPAAGRRAAPGRSSLEPPGRRRRCRARRSVGRGRCRRTAGRAGPRGRRRSGRRRRASGSGDRRGRWRRHCDAPRRRPVATHRRARRPPRPCQRQRASARCSAKRLRTSTGGHRPACARRRSSRSHGSIAACSGKRPTWPASVGRSSIVRSSMVGGPAGGRRGRRPDRSSRARRSKRRSASAHRSGVRRSPKPRQCGRVDDVLAEPFEASPAAGIDERVVVHRASSSKPLRPGRRIDRKEPEGGLRGPSCAGPVRADRHRRPSARLHHPSGGGSGGGPSAAPAASQGAPGY